MRKGITQFADAIRGGAFEGVILRIFNQLDTDRYPGAEEAKLETASVLYAYAGD